MATERWLNRLKERFKASPKLYLFLQDVCSPVLLTGKNFRVLLDPSTRAPASLDSARDKLAGGPSLGMSPVTRRGVVLPRTECRARHEVSESRAAGRVEGRRSGAPGLPGGLHWLPANALVLNLGSGSRRLSRSIINVDFLPYPEVDLVADLARLPFQDDAVDGMICEFTLEHVRDRHRTIKEIQRTLKPGGCLYAAVPFILGYHTAPNDYYRWTKEGLIAELEGIEMLEVGIRGGPTSGLLWVFQEWLALALSCNIPIVYHVLWILLVVLMCPLKLLDLLFSRYSMAWKIAAGFYYVGVKK